VGGASKLFAEFLRNALCDEVISYSDNRLFSGKMYEKLGFKLEHEVAPDYWYVTPGNNMERKHKSNFQKERLKSMFENYDENLSESENCKNNSWYQVFDCGKKKWSYKC
jgi:predicted acetyltransferase